jgi:hypothetical protein
MEEAESYHSASTVYELMTAVSGLENCRGNWRRRRSALMCISSSKLIVDLMLSHLLVNFALVPNCRQT